MGIQKHPFTVHDGSSTRVLGKDLPANPKHLSSVFSGISLQTYLDVAKFSVMVNMLEHLQEASTIGYTFLAVFKEEDGKLKIGGTAKTQMEKDMMWDSIKQAGGDAPGDVEADIKVENTDYYGVHTVVSGDTLGKLAKKYLGKPSRYMDTFNMNTDILSNPDLIKVGQELKIPNK